MLTLLLPFGTVLFGGIVAYIVQPKTPKGVKLLLSFSGSFLLAILLLEMLPPLYQNGSNQSGYWILGGILFQNILEFFSKGAEHGHIHYATEKRLPWVLLLSLCLHAFFEGMPLADNPELLWGVSVHKLPIALVVGLMLFKSQVPYGIKIAVLFLFAAMTPLGSFIANFVEKSLIESTLTPFVVGVLFHISTTILFESSEGHTFNRQKFLSTLLGIGLALVF